MHVRRVSRGLEIQIPGLQSPLAHRTTITAAIPVRRGHPVFARLVPARGRWRPMTAHEAGATLPVHDVFSFPAHIATKKQKHL